MDQQESRLMKAIAALVFALDDGTFDAGLGGVIPRSLPWMALQTQGFDLDTYQRALEALEGIRYVRLTADTIRRGPQHAALYARAMAARDEARR